MSLRDTLISRDYRCPEPGIEEEIILPWMSGMHDLVTSATQNMPRVGWFVPSCPLHVIYSHAQDVVVEDIHTGDELNAYTALKQWMEGAEVHAIDSLEQENMSCP